LSKKIFPEKLSHKINVNSKIFSQAIISLDKGETFSLGNIAKKVLHEE
jgi:hypothetical protein